MNWNLKEQVPTFHVTRLTVAIDYYGRLGFGVQWRWPREEPSHIGLRCGSCALMLIQGSSSSGHGEVYFVVDDVDACYQAFFESKPWEAAREHAAALESDFQPDPASLECVKAPELRDHGHRDFVIVDPWGHRLTFGCDETHST